MLPSPTVLVISVKLLAQNMSSFKVCVLMPWRFILAGQSRLGGLFIFWPALYGYGQDDESEEEFIHFFPKKKKRREFQFIL